MLLELLLIPSYSQIVGKKEHDIVSKNGIKVFEIINLYAVYCLFSQKNHY